MAHEKEIAWIEALHDAVARADWHTAHDLATNTQGLFFFEGLDCARWAHAADGKRLSFKPLIARLSPNDWTLIMALARVRLGRADDAKCNPFDWNVLVDGAPVFHRLAQNLTVAEAMHECVPRIKWTMRDAKGRTVLHKAVEQGAYEWVKAMTPRLGAILTLLDDSGNTALEIAIKDGNEHVAKLLAHTPMTPGKLKFVNNELRKLRWNWTVGVVASAKS